jgi:hypothetical protein
MDYIGELDLYNVRTWDIQGTEKDPFDDEVLRTAAGYIDKYLQRAEGNPILIQRGEELRSLLHTKGIQKEPILVVIGEKA